MKHIIQHNLLSTCLAALGLSFFLTSAQDVEAQTYREKTVLAPSDLGITKYSLSASPPSDQVMVFRQKKTIDGKDVDIFETISFTNGKERIAEVALFRPSLFPYSTPEIQKLPVTIKSDSGGFSISEGFMLKQWSCGEEGVRFFCENDKGNRIVYSFFIEIQSLKDAIKRIPELASKFTSEESEWTYAVTIKTED